VRVETGLLCYICSSLHSLLQIGEITSIVLIFRGKLAFPRIFDTYKPYASCHRRPHGGDNTPHQPALSPSTKLADSTPAPSRLQTLLRLLLLQAELTRPSSTQCRLDPWQYRYFPAAPRPVVRPSRTYSHKNTNLPYHCTNSSLLSPRPT
jgi:hypothetical protein